MTFAFAGTHTEAAWKEWQGRNVTVEDGHLRLAREGVPTYVSPTLLVDDPPSSFTPVAFDVDGCGDLYVLTAAAELYRYDREKESLRQLVCVWYPEAERDEDAAADATVTRAPVGICVTSDTIYVADGALPGVVAISKRSLQTRWMATDDFERPVGLVHYGRTGYVLDAGRSDGMGFVLPLTVTGVGADPVAEGFTSPADLATDPEGDLYVLDRTADASDPNEGGPRHVVRRFRTSDGAEGFEEAPDAEVEVPGAYDPRCIEAPGDGGFLVGAGPDAVGETTPYRYLPGADPSSRGRFARIPSFKEPCADLVLDDRPGHGRLYAIAGPEGQVRVYRLDEATPNRRNPATDGHDARAWRRFDSGESGTAWHRVTAGVRLDGTGTNVRLRYRATDSVDVGTLEADFDIAGVHADRLREADITGAWRLVEVGPEDLATLCSVPPEWTERWVEAARTLADATVGPDINALTGIGPTFGDRLREAGVETLADLLARDAETVAAIAEAPPANVATWQHQAREIVDQAVDADWATALGIEGIAAAQLADAGVTRFSDLLGTGPADLAERLRVPRSRTEAWVDRARARIELAWSREETATLADPSDALLDAAEGRYLWIAIDLLGGEFASPTVETFRAYFPRGSYLRHMPAIYQEDAESAAFLERFLSVFESTFVGVEEDIGSVTRYLDAEGIPAGYLAWLGRWLAVDTDEHWPEQVQRAMLARAPALFKQRGTRDGLLTALGIYLGDPPTLPEAYAAAVDRERRALQARVGAGDLTAREATAESERLTRAASLLENADLDCIDDDAVQTQYETLLGCPQCFLVLIPPYATDEQVAAADRLVESNTPAHSVGRTVGLRPRFQLAGDSHPGHTYLGVNSTLADREFLLEESNLGADSALDAHEAFSRLELASRLDTDTVLS